VVGRRPRRPQRQLWSTAGLHPPYRHGAARARVRAQRSDRAAGQQFDRASHHLFRRHGVRRDRLHRPCGDEPQPARQYLYPAGAEARALPGRPRARRSPCRRRRTAAAARPLRGVRRRYLLWRGCALCAVQRLDRRRPGRRCGDPVHLRHERAAQGRGLELPRAPLSTGRRRSFSARSFRSIAAPRW
jgi:hypothetical protein